MDLYKTVITNVAKLRDEACTRDLRPSRLTIGKKVEVLGHRRVRDGCTCFRSSPLLNRGTIYTFIDEYFPTGVYSQPLP